MGVLRLDLAKRYFPIGVLEDLVYIFCKRDVLLHLGFQ